MSITSMETFDVSRLRFKKDSVIEVRCICPVCHHKCISPNYEISEQGVGTHVCETCGNKFAYQVGLAYMELEPDTKLIADGKEDEA